MRRRYRSLSVLAQALESRVLFNASYFPLVNGPLTQNWSNTSLIQTNNDWSVVPGIEGFRGTTLGVTTTGVDPRTVLSPDAAGTATYVLANVSPPSTPASIGVGGLAEFHLADPVVALQGGTNGSAPHLVFYLNTSGLTDAVPVTYVLRDIDDQADGTVTPIAAQYRIGTTGDFTNIPAAYIANAAGAAGTATKTTTVSFNLPAETLNQPQVQLRIITTDAAGNDEWIGIDDISIGTTIPKSIQFAQSTQNVNESAGTASVTLTRAGDLTSTASVRVTSADLAATAGQDYAAINQVVNFASGQASATVSLSVTNDTTAETAERLTLTLSNVTGASIGAPSQLTVALIDDDSTAPTGLLINELSVDPPGPVDTPYEFAEIRGAASSTLFNVYLVQFEGDPNSPGGRSGVADAVFDLGASTTGSNGMLMIRGEGGFSPTDGATAQLISSRLSTGADALESDAQTWLLIFSPTPIEERRDYDPSVTFTGVLNLPAGAVVLDSIAWQSVDLNNVFGNLYSTAILPVGALPVQAATRVRGNNAVENSSAWFFGSLDLNSGATSLGYDASLSSSNLPPGAQLTPGAANFTTVTDTTAPTLVSVNWFPDLTGIKPIVNIVFSEAMHGITLSDLASSSFTIINRATSQPIPAGQFELSKFSSTTYRIGFAGSGIPANGDYQLLIHAANVKDLANNALGADTTFDFSFLQADVDNNRRVDTSDFNVLAGNFGSPAHFSTGDFSFDGSADSIDFDLFVAAYGASLPALPGNAPPLFAVMSADPDKDLIEV